MQRTNSHPFLHGRWLFQHNGDVGDFRLMRAICNVRWRPSCSPTSAATPAARLCFIWPSPTAGQRPAERHAARGWGCRAPAGPGIMWEMPAFLTLGFTDGRSSTALRYSRHHDSKEPVLQPRIWGPSTNLNGRLTEAISPGRRGTSLGQGAPWDESSRDDWGPGSPEFHPFFLPLDRLARVKGQSPFRPGF